ncbi:hypothetical protein NW754_001652 [Fusarium falciforme]|uniref:Zn(2)-C6 fungal-type domain-containing protein n=1 Tax=Fusarium falciforme TaxID=195108 RepID=A0A9W8V5E3_9HYPO|nr:hypothetical protein NW754_001652 [Fusarium falciforme]KAJ4195595.1 hypothetical protein NW755_001756 [Fusarium falciforme]
MASRTRPQSSRNIERSCAVCHRRKVRCDKKLPCNQCIRGGFPCSYPPVQDVIRRTRKTTISDVATRISEMEKTIEAFKSGQVASPQVPLPTPSTSLPARPRDSPASETTEQNRREGLLLSKGRVSHYVNEVLFSRVIEQEHDVRTALATPRSESPPSSSFASPFNPMGLLSNTSSTVPLASFHPPRSLAMKLWKMFVESVDPCTKVMHVPTTEVRVYTVLQDPSKASAENLGVCFSIYYASATALDRDVVEAFLGEDRQTALHRYKAGLEQALAETDFLENPTIPLLQALAVYLAAMRVNNSGRAVWIMNGLALRAAQSMGLHRDGRKLGLSPFESEIRRRLWWHFLERDGRGGEDYGLQNPSGPNPLYAVDQPRNLHDSDLSPEMKELPESRPGWTRMTLSLVNIQIARAWGRLFQMGWSTEVTPGEEVRAAVVKDASIRAHEILQGCNPLIPEQMMTVVIARFLVQKLDIVSRRQWQSLHQPDDRNFWATENNLLEALSVLEQCNSMWDIEDLSPYHWITRAFPQYHMIFYILRHLCACPRGPNASRAFEAVEKHLATVNRGETGAHRGLMWTVLTTLRERAMMMMQNDGAEVEAEPQGVSEKGDGRQQTTVTDGGAVPEQMQHHIEGEHLLPPDWDTVLQDFPWDMDDFNMTF